MRAGADYLEGLIDLASQPDRNLRRAMFRQAIAALSLVDTRDGPALLDSLHPDALLKSVRAALADGLLDDLGWLAPPAAAVALYEIAAALPLGPERRDLGRRVLGQLYAGNAATFVAVAARMATGTSRGLSGAGVRARVALALALPASADIPVDALALALASRRELCRDWIAANATGSLPDRRLSARLIERATREATRRATQGDDLPLRLFRNVAEGSRALERGADPVALAWRALLADREALVWRHVAVARGLLAAVLPDAADEVRALLSPDLSPTEWRRGAASLAAGIALDPDGALPRALDLLRGPLPGLDAGVATAMIWALPAAADAEPEAAEALLDAVTAAAPLATAEAVVELRRDLGAAGRGPTSFGASAAARCAAALAEALGARNRKLSKQQDKSPKQRPDDDGLTAVAQAIHRDLTGAADEAAPLDAAIDAAIAAFVMAGPREAHARALEALDAATGAVRALEALDVSDAPEAAAARRDAAALVRDIDDHLLGAGALKSLLLLDRRPSEDATGVAALDDLDERLAAWLLRVETSGGGAAPAHATLHQRNLRALLHLIDGETADFDRAPERKARVLARWTGACGALLNRLRADRRRALRRAVAATVARALDAVVREGAADAADVLLFAGMRAENPDDLDVLGEASMHPDVGQLLRAYARFARSGAEGPAPAPSDGAAEADRTRHALARVAALEALLADLPAGASQRTDVVRGALARLARSLAAIQGALALSSLADADGDDGAPLASLEDALTRLSQLTAGARRRCGDDPGPPASARWPLRVAVEVALLGEGGAPPDLGPAIDAVVANARAGVPSAISDVVAAVVGRVAGLPLRRPSAPSAPPLSEQPLPAWLPSRRTLGGFYVHRQLGGGSVGTVFLVTRAEERHDPGAERFALKVPEYDHRAARTVSEADFLRLFRQEAGALLAVPEHPNLARFVTFDAGARPKPILVMELIEGVRCDKLLEARGLSMRGALALLDGILAGLEAMHGVGVGHLDLKPTNVILRGGREPVLVDFGLAGRHIRPGCATACYGAPEVWEAEGLPDEGARPGQAAPRHPAATPLTADMYSFGCIAYEILTGRTLFDGTTDVALISAHITHDGLPPPVKRLAASPRTADIAAFLFACLRHDPRARAAATAQREALARLTRQLHEARWPLDS